MIEYLTGLLMPVLSIGFAALVATVVVGQYKHYKDLTKGDQ